MTIQIPEEETQRLVPLIQQHFRDELKEEIGNFDAESLLAFFVREAGPIIYNRAIDDVRAYLKGMVSDLEYGLYELEKPTSSPGWEARRKKE